MRKANSGAIQSLVINPQGQTLIPCIYLTFMIITANSNLNFKMCAQLTININMFLTNLN